MVNDLGCSGLLLSQNGPRFSEGEWSELLVFVTNLLIEKMLAIEHQLLEQ